MLALHWHVLVFVCVCWWPKAAFTCKTSGVVQLHWGACRNALRGNHRLSNKHLHCIVAFPFASDMHWVIFCNHMKLYAFVFLCFEFLHIPLLLGSAGSVSIASWVRFANDGWKPAHLLRIISHPVAQNFDLSCFELFLDLQISQVPRCSSWPRECDEGSGGTSLVTHHVDQSLAFGGTFLRAYHAGQWEAQERNRAAWLRGARMWTVFAWKQLKSNSGKG